jgi:hypothetical protein
MSFWTSTLRKRRKPHRCATCGQVVAAGEHSYDESGLCDGEFNAFRQCRACNDIVRYFFWRGTFDRYSYILCELADYARDVGLIWPPVYNFVEQGDTGNMEDGQTCGISTQD